MPEAPKDAFLNDYAERNTTNVILSHMPMLFTPESFVQNVHSIVARGAYMHLKIYFAPLSVTGTQRVVATGHFYRARTQSDAHKFRHGDGSVERRLDSVAV